MPRMKRKKAVSGNEREVTRSRRSAAGPDDEDPEVTTGGDPQDSALLDQSSMDLQQPLQKKIKINVDGESDNLVVMVDREFVGKTITSSKKISPDASLQIPTLTKEEFNENTKASNNEPDTIYGKDQLRALLEHRKILLIRTRQTQAMARKRIASLTSPVISGEEEIAKYHESIKNVNTTIRKQQTEGATEKRPVGRRASSLRVNQPKAASSATSEPLNDEGLKQFDQPKSLKRPLPSNAAARNQKIRPRRPPPRAFCPETTALRDKRDDLRQKLMALAQARKPQEEAIKSQVVERRRSSMSVTSARTPALSRMDHSIHQDFMTGSELPPRLPSRRRTHWDTLLQEMRWLATDFREERKWKHSSAQLLGDELLSRNLAPPNAEAVDAKRAEAISPEKEQIDNATIMSELVLNTKVVSNEDAVHARGVAAQIANKVAECFSSLGIERETTDNKQKMQSEIVHASNGDSRNGMVRSNSHGLLDEVLEAMAKKPLTSRKSRSESYGLKLTEFQEDIVLAIEDRWQRIKIGVFVRGPLASGKTICACSLLWRSRERGPQIVVCSPGSMMRWVSEIKRFSGLTVRVIQSWHSTISLSAGDVLLCAYSMVSDVSSLYPEVFDTVIVDSRHPTGFKGSGMNEGLEYGHDTPAELLHISWWTKLAEFASSRNRIILGRLDGSFSFLRNVSNRQRLSILGLQIGLLIGVSHFHNHGYSLEKSILGWGRTKTKKISGRDSKYRKVLTLFSDTIQNCCIEVKDGNRRHSSDEDVWDIRLCEMPLIHRHGYLDVCREVSAVLSRGNCDSEDVAKALMVLRQNCVFTKRRIIEEMLMTAKRRLFSFAQPDIDAASALLLHSAKLHELAEILVFEFGIRIPSSALKGLPLGDKKKTKAKGRVATNTIKRIAILAVSTDVQLLISTLLCHLGILHHLVMDNYSVAVKFPWFNFQETLCSFNEHSGDDPAVLIAPPCLVAGDHAGLGIERADAVICIEDDWSGRGELLMQSLTQRNRYRRDAEGLSICRFINLTTRDSIEEKLVKYGSCLGKDESLDAWPSVHCFTNPFGMYNVARPSDATLMKTQDSHALWEEGPYSPSLASFPARNIFRAAGHDLEDLLCSRKSPSSILAKNKKTTLLSSHVVETFSTLLFELVICEDKCSPSIPLLSALRPENLMVSDALSQTNGLEDLLSGRLKAFMARTNSDIQACSSNRQLCLNRETPTLLIGDNHSGRPELSEKQQLPPATKGATSGTYLSQALFYGPSGGSTVEKRSNLFVSVYSSFCVRSDCRNQINESLVYFPPLFPLLKECSVIAQENMETLLRNAPSTIDQNPDEDQNHDKSMNHVVTEEEALQSDAASVLIDLYDDYGIVGLGAIPFPRDSALAAASLSVTAANARPVDIDSAEAQETNRNGGSNAIILLTSKKRKRGPGIASQPSALWNGLDCRISIGMVEANEISLETESQHPTEASLATQNPYPDQNSLESRRHNLLTSLRQFGMGTSMFEAPIYRVASVRVRNNVSSRLVRHLWSPGPLYDAGPGLPLIISKNQATSVDSNRGFFDADPSLWTSMVKRLRHRDSETGEEALDLSNGQRAAMRRSLVVPCRVDFGPFQCGFLSTTTGSSMGAPPRARVGVALPMGVKISSSMNRDQMSLPWTSEDDRLLHKAAERFCLNWVVVAAELSGFLDIAVVSHSESPRFRPIRAARSCRDRWQRLARNNPSMLADIRQSERFTFSPAQPPSTVLNEAQQIKADVDADSPNLLLLSNDNSRLPVQEKPRRRTFHAFRTSRARTQQPPLQIPGIVPGSNATIVPSHQSHEQHSCKPDLCPLHILDPSTATS